MIDVEVKVMSMQGTHIFKRDTTTQLIKCMPWTMKVHPHPNIIKKMRTFLEVENDMGPVIPPSVSQFRPLIPETNHNIRKSDSTEKRKRACLALPQTTPCPTYGASAAPATVREDTP